MCQMQGSTRSHLKKMKSRWLCSVATCRLRKLAFYPYTFAASGKGPHGLT